MAQSFHEYRYVRQTPGEPELRWFQSDYFELFVWFNESSDDEVIAFRLCYNRGYQERAITWEKASGRIRHDTVDDGGGAIESHRPAPVLVPHRDSIPARVIERFHQTPGEVPTDIRHLVFDRLSAVQSEAPPIVGQG